MRPKTHKSPSKHPSSEILRLKLQTKRSQTPGSQTSIRTLSSASSQGFIVKIEPESDNSRDLSSIGEDATLFSSPSVDKTGPSNGSTEYLTVELPEDEDVELNLQHESIADQEMSVDFEEAEHGVDDERFRRTVYRKRDGTCQTRYRPGVIVQREIRYYQRRPNLLLLQRAPFSRLVRGIAKEITRGRLVHNIRFAREAMDALQESTESFVAEILKDSNLLAIHDKRVTIMPKDMEKAQRLRHPRRN